jgi:hypothetical protein
MVMSQHESTINQRRRPHRARFGSPSHQAGLGALGWLIVLAIVSFGLTCFFKVGPVYLDYWNTKNAVEAVVNDSKAASMSKDELRSAIQKQLDVSMIKTIAVKDIKISDERGARELDASYEKRVELLANIDVVVKFDKLKYKLSVADE